MARSASTRGRSARSEVAFVPRGLVTSRAAASSSSAASLQYPAEGLDDLRGELSLPRLRYPNFAGETAFEQKRCAAAPPWSSFPGSNRVVYQPLGVVGIVAPWNYPVSLALAPLATAIAAGNRVMLKPSEFTPATTALLASMLGEFYDEDQVAVVTGDAKVGAEFTGLKFDHILFTGSTPVGRLVMRAASENLVPVTLELGGKSPVIVERGTSIEDTAYRIAHGKLANGGQTWVAPDYALVPEEEVEAFTAAFEQAVDRLYPSIATNPDYTWIINDHHFARLTGLVEDAVARGARMIEIGARPSGTSGSQSRLFPPKLLLGVTDEMNVIHEEIFGPILLVVTYRELEDAIAYVNARPRPLALYVFGADGPGRRRVLEHTTSGNVVVNDTLFHYVQDDLPFGGVGASGMGDYHGPEGFKNLSHAKGIYTQARFNVAEGSGRRSGAPPTSSASSLSAR
jgi:coniferyl-aldehyde dehydrogenase